MSGKDVTAEAQDFEKTLPVEFQSMLQSFQAQAGAMGAGLPTEEPMTATETSAMTEEQARALVAKAAAEGAISKEQAASLLKAEGKSPVALPNELSSPLPGFSQPDFSQKDEAVQPGLDTQAPLSSEDEKSSKLGKFWRNLSGKKSS
jgi:hypothetical protein